MNIDCGFLTFRKKIDIELMNKVGEDCYAQQVTDEIVSEIKEKYGLDDNRINRKEYAECVKTAIAHEKKIRAFLDDVSELYQKHGLYLCRYHDYEDGCDSFEIISEDFDEFIEEIKEDYCI